MKRFAIFTLILVVILVGSYYVYFEYKDKEKLKVIETARLPITNMLKDPLSAQFRNESILSNNKTVCGEVNAKNSIGGYVGFKNYISDGNYYLIEGGSLDTWPILENKVNSLESSDKVIISSLKFIQSAENNVTDLDVRKYADDLKILLFSKVYINLCMENKLLATEANNRFTTVTDERNGILYLPNENKPFTGIYLQLYPNGQKKEELNIKNGLYDGVATMWNDNGQKRMESNYKNGLLDGVYSTFLFSELKSNEDHYIQGEREGLSISWSPNGRIRRKENYKNGKLDGLKILYYDNGSKFIETNYKDGKKDGLETLWKDIIEKWSEATYKDGRKIGVRIWCYLGKTLIMENEKLKDMKCQD